MSVLNAIRCGNTGALNLAYLVRQYAQGLGMVGEPRKAFTAFMDGARKGNPECIFELGYVLPSVDREAQLYNFVYFV